MSWILTQILSCYRFTWDLPQTKGMKMKTRLTILMAALALLIFISPRAANSQGFSFSAGIQISGPADFYAPLTPYGTWINFGTYGQCWQPTQISPGWRPYAYGSWQWTDAGWYWQSDEPWAWACYHYGSWTFDPTMGWIWIPGTQWAPAW